MSKKGSAKMTLGNVGEQETEPQANLDALSREVESLRRRQFQERVQRVLEVMGRERIDWRGVAFVSPDGRIGVRVVPVEMQ